MRNEDRLARLGPLSGVLFVALELGGFAIGVAGGRATVTLGAPTAKVLSAFSTHAGTAVWIGAYMELASLAAFAIFAAWLCRSRPGPLAAAGMLSAGAYIAVAVVGLVVGDVLQYGAAHDMGAQAIVALFDLQSGVYFASWGIAAAFLLLAPATGWLRRSAVTVAALLLVALAAPTAGPSQFPNMLFLLWVVVASAALSRQPAALSSPTPATA